MTRRRPVWFRNGLVPRNPAGPPSRQGLPTAAAVAGGPIASIPAARHRVSAGGLPAPAILSGGTAATLTAPVVALHPSGKRGPNHPME